MPSEILLIKSQLNLTLKYKSFASRLFNDINLRLINKDVIFVVCLISSNKLLHLCNRLRQIMMKKSLKLFKENCLLRSLKIFLKISRLFCFLKASMIKLPLISVIWRTKFSVSSLGYWLEWIKRSFKFKNSNKSKSRDNAKLWEEKSFNNNEKKKETRWWHKWTRCNNFEDKFIKWVKAATQWSSH